MKKECDVCEGKGWYEADGGGGNVVKVWCKKCEGWGLTREYVDGIMTDLGYEKVEEEK
jgi:hypothetical protein